MSVSLTIPCFTKTKLRNCYGESLEINSGRPGYHAIPKGYYTQFNGVGNIGFTALGDAYVYDKTGTFRQDSTHTGKFY